MGSTEHVWRGTLRTLISCLRFPPLRLCPSLLLPVVVVVVGRELDPSDRASTLPGATYVAVVAAATTTKSGSKIAKGLLRPCAPTFPAPPPPPPPPPTPATVLIQATCSPLFLTCVCWPPPPPSVRLSAPTCRWRRGIYSTKYHAKPTSERQALLLLLLLLLLPSSS